MNVVARDPAAVTIGIVAGEASGDALGSDLIRAVRARVPEVRFAGIGGPRMEAAGCELWYPHTELALRGYAEVITHLPALLRIRGDVFRRLRAANAPLFVGVDAPDFNLGLEAKLKRRRIRTMHYVSPSVWVAPRAHRHDRALGRSSARTVSIRAAALRRCRHQGDLRRSSLAAGAATATGPGSARTVEIRDGHAGFALLPGSRMSSWRCMRASAEDRGGFVRSAAAGRFVVPLVSRAAREYFERVQYACNWSHCR